MSIFFFISATFCNELIKMRCWCCSPAMTTGLGKICISSLWTALQLNDAWAIGSLDEILSKIKSSNWIGTAPWSYEGHTTVYTLCVRSSIILCVPCIALNIRTTKHSLSALSGKKVLSLSDDTIGAINLTNLNLALLRS